MVNWALDSLIETVQKYYHKMNFHTGKGHGWLKHSSHVLVMSKVSHTVVEEYSCLNSVEDKDSKFVDHQDSNLKQSKMHNNTKPLSTPRQAKEACTVAEFLKFSKITQEIPGKHYEDNELWLNLSRSTVQLADESDRGRGELVVKELQTEEEHLLGRFTDVLCNQRNCDSESEERNDDNIKIEDGGIDPAVLAGRMEID